MLIRGNKGEDFTHEENTQYALLAGAMLATALTGCGGSASSSSDSQNSGSDSTASGTAFKDWRHRPADRRGCYLRQRLQERRTDRG